MNISGDLADTVCIGGKTHGVRLFAFIYKEGCLGVRTALFARFQNPVRLLFCADGVSEGALRDYRRIWLYFDVFFTLFA